MQDTASQRRQDSLLFVHAFLADTATATLGPSAPGGGVSEQSTTSGLCVLDGTVPRGVAETRLQCARRHSHCAVRGHCARGLQGGRDHDLCAAAGRSEATQVPAGVKAGDKFPVMFPAPVLFPVVAPEGKKARNEIEHDASHGKLSKVTMSDGCEEGKPDTTQHNVTPAMNKDDVASKATDLSESTLLRIDGLERGAGCEGPIPGHTETAKPPVLQVFKDEIHVDSTLATLVVPKAGPAMTRERD